jgi:hypothetical protein
MSDRDRERPAVLYRVLQLAPPGLTHGVRHMPDSLCSSHGLALQFFVSASANNIPIRVVVGISAIQGQCFLRYLTARVGASCGWRWILPRPWSGKAVTDACCRAPAPSVTRGPFACSMDHAFVVCDPSMDECPIVFASNAFLRMVGLTR